ncbi:RNB domain-containing ribonuclease [Nocardioides convexus]|uniref:RNB domain-containing ribonuclease n=1 Tax=Nocardioides convexus TaxID=2712224 RepID=UPI0024183822|nr:RNB domain-containing ribonuclease [Nocardioides convexus]
MDLDQAVHIEKAGDGYVVHYAIADVAAFVHPGDPVDQEAHRRGETLYGAGTRIPLHPPALSEGAASLLPDQVRPALLWTIGVDAAGALGKVSVERATVRSTARWSYVDAQKALDDGTAGDVLVLLREVGRLREQQEVDRGGVSLPLPEQEVDEVDGGFRLVFRQQTPGRAVERPDLAAHRHRRRLADGRRQGRPAADPAAGRPARRRPAAPGRQGPADLVAGRPRLPGVHPLPRPREARAPGDGRGVHPAAARQRVRRLRRRASPSRRSTPRSPPSTPTSRRRCAASGTGTPARCASRSAPAPPSRTG